MNAFKRKYYFGIFTLLLFSLTLGSFFAATPDDKKTNEEITTLWQQTFQKILPPGWSIEATGQSYPTRYEPGVVMGVALHFKGTQNAKFVGRHDDHKGKEEFTLWIMPLDYKPKIKTIDPANSGAFARLPEYIGSNGNYQVYCLTAFSSLPSWPTWQSDIKALLKIERENIFEHRAKPSHIDCSNINNCVFLGTMGSHDSFIYCVKINDEDKRTYYLYNGDSVGNYIIYRESIDKHGLELTNNIGEVLIIKKKKMEIYEGVSVPGQEFQESKTTNYVPSQMTNWNE